MKIHNFILILLLTISLIFVNAAGAYWLWTPETKKFVNPKYAVKDNPKDQYDWAMSFYEAKDYTRAAAEFEKLTKNFEYSEYAAKAQYYTGLCYENMGKFYMAFQNYQKTIDNFPHIENMDEIIAREFNIANIYAVKESPKVLGTDIMTSIDRAIEIYKKVVDNSPYGKLADEAQFKMGLALKKAERYDEAIAAFQRVLDDYPSSKFYDEAKYEVANCAYKASLKPDYDIEPTNKAIRAYEDVSQTSGDQKLSQEASKAIQRLRDRSAEKSMSVARFYESQKHYESAIIYYQDVLDKFPESSAANVARAKIEELKKRKK
jgi:outer membrane assembly lipoprotein YfiO